MKKVTIYDVAKLANCSTATVSLVLSDSKRIPATTKQRVLKAVKELGYTPSFIAQSLNKKNSNTIGVIIPNIENPLFSEMLSGIEGQINAAGYQLILGLSNSNYEKEFLYLEMLQNNRVDGLIVLPSFPEALMQKLESANLNTVPVVLCGSSGINTNLNISYAKCDNFLGAYMAVEHLINIGRKRIACVFPVSNETQYHSRRAGYIAALKDYNISFDDALIKICQQDNDAIFATTKELIHTQKPDAIYCLYDNCAISVMRALVSEGLRIPEDIALIGYDNIQMSKFLPTSLSTIDTQGSLVGSTAAKLLLDKIRDPKSPVNQVIIEPKLVVRESTTLQHQTKSTDLKTS